MYGCSVCMKPVATLSQLRRRGERQEHVVISVHVNGDGEMTAVDFFVEAQKRGVTEQRY